MTTSRACALAVWAAVVTSAAVEGCTPPSQRKPIEMTPIGTVPNVTRTVEEEPSDSGVTTPNSGTPSPVKEAICTGGEFDSLGDTLRQCDTPMPRAGDVPVGMKDKLDVRVVASTPSTPPGGRVDLTVTLKNKSNEPLPLYFTGDPSPRFEVEALDAKGRRADLPNGKPPKSTTPAPTREVKALRITLTPGGTAKVRLAWEAVRTRWAPEKAKTWDGKGPPRAPAGPLPTGRYQLRVVLPLIGAFDKGELDPPKIPMDVGGG